MIYNLLKRRNRKSKYQAVLIYIEKQPQTQNKANYSYEKRTVPKKNIDFDISKP